MDCKDTTKAIPLFFSGELEGRKIKSFLRHLNECPDCMEEIKIQYLATEGINRLEQGETFDLDRELGEMLSLAEHHEKNRRWIRFGLVTIEVLSLVIIAIVLFYGFM